MRGKRAQAHECADETGARRRRKDVIVVIGRMAVEEGDLLLLVLLPAALVVRARWSPQARVFCRGHRSSVAHAGGGFLRCRSRREIVGEPPAQQIPDAGVALGKHEMVGIADKVKLARLAGALE